MRSGIAQLITLLAAADGLKLGSAVGRRSLLAGVASAVALPANAATEVPKDKVGVTPGGVKYFTKVSDTTCSPFNPCTPQEGDIVKIKYKSYLSNGQMYDSSEVCVPRWNLYLCGVSS